LQQQRNQQPSYDNIKWNELSNHFKTVQSKHERSKHSSRHSHSQNSESRSSSKQHRKSRAINSSKEDIWQNESSKHNSLDRQLDKNYHEHRSSSSHLSNNMNVNSAPLIATEAYPKQTNYKSKDSNISKELPVIPTVTGNPNDNRK
jgi:hypothetical protein